ncbi:MAG: TetR/AcrR family transcriptional regulator [Chloroflexota bacterium]
MAYRSSEKTRQKKDAKRTAMMQAAVSVFAEKGYHSATIRDIVKESNVAIGTFYFYFPDKETLFVHLYEETADFLLQTIEQGVRGQESLSKKIQAGLQAYLNIAVYEPAIINLLLVGGIGAVPSLAEKRLAYRERLTSIWQKVIDQAIDRNEIPEQNSRRMAELFSGGYDEIILNVLLFPEPAIEASSALIDMINYTLNAVGYTHET